MSFSHRNRFPLFYLVPVIHEFRYSLINQMRGVYEVFFLLLVILFYISVFMVESLLNLQIILFRCYFMTEAEKI